MAKQSTLVEPAEDDVATAVVADTVEVAVDSSAVPAPDVVEPTAPETDTAEPGEPAPAGFLVLWPVDHDGRRYDPGSVIPAETISEDAAARLRAIGAIGG